MAYCVPKGIPHSRFRLWSPDDQDKALQFEREMRKVCRCGTRPEEWLTDKEAYVGQQYVCPGCEVKQQEEQNVPEDQAGYTHVYLAPKDQALPPDEV